MRTIIIDDEEKARKTIISFLQLNCSDVEIIAQADSVQNGIKVIKEHKPELVFLDINLPDGTGFDILNALDSIQFKLIFVTAYEEYAIKAFKFSALDYLLKPINPQELVQSVEKARKSIDQETFDVKYKTFIANYSNQSNTDKKLVLKTSESIFMIDIKDIIRCEADGGYTTFFLNDGRKILVSKNLKEYEDILLEYNFFRPHNSHLVNLNYMLSFEKRDGGTIIMKDKSAVPVATRRKDDLMNRFENMM